MAEIEVPVCYPGQSSPKILTRTGTMFARMEYGGAGEAAGILVERLSAKE